MSGNGARAGKQWNIRRLDVRAFARDAVSLEGREPLDQFSRLHEECVTELDAEVVWALHGETRPSGAGAEPSVWMHLFASAHISMTCQRCLEPVVLPLSTERWFRFVESEEAAEAEDEDADEDVLSLNPLPDVHELIEDELLMELPLVPMHEVCPVKVKTQAGNIDEESSEDQRPHPFAGLEALKKPR